jgi:hypothetical protein
LLLGVIALLSMIAPIGDAIAQSVLRRENVPRAQAFQFRIAYNSVRYGPNEDLFFFATTHQNVFSPLYRYGYVFNPNTGQVTTLSNACEGFRNEPDARMRALIGDDGPSADWGAIYPFLEFLERQPSYWPTQGQVRFLGDGRIAYTCFERLRRAPGADEPGAPDAFFVHDRIVAEAQLPGVPGPPPRVVRIAIPGRTQTVFLQRTREGPYVTGPEMFTLSPDDDSLIHWADEPAPVVGELCPPARACRARAIGLTHADDVMAIILPRDPRGAPLLGHALLRLEPSGSALRVVATRPVQTRLYQSNTMLLASRGDWIAFRANDADPGPYESVVVHFWNVRENRSVIVHSTPRGPRGNLGGNDAAIDASGRFGVIGMRRGGSSQHFVAIVALSGSGDRVITYDEAAYFARLPSDAWRIGVSAAGHVFAFRPRSIDYLGTLRQGAAP